jgi:hypothetical protein
MKKARPGWTKRGVIIAGITLAVMVLFGILQIYKTTKQNTIQGNRNIQVEESDKPQIAQGNNNTQKIQSTQGNNNIQVQGDNNIINKGTIIQKTEAKSRLFYRVSKLQRTNDGKYQTEVTFWAVGNVPVFTPQIFVIFDKAVQQVMLASGSGQASEYNTDAFDHLGKDTFYFKTSEIKPGSDYVFIITNDSEFKLIKVRLNDQDLKPNLAEPD